jgi:hypothetical protein
LTASASSCRSSAGSRCARKFGSQDRSSGPLFLRERYPEFYKALDVIEPTETPESTWLEAGVELAEYRREKQPLNQE